MTKVTVADKFSLKTKLHAILVFFRRLMHLSKIHGIIQWQDSVVVDPPQTYHDGFNAMYNKASAVDYVDSSLFQTGGSAAMSTAGIHPLG